jgi:hypothetical protein
MPRNQSFMFSPKIYRTVAYLGLIPFLIFTYQTWCGPIEDVRASTRAFLVFSACVLVFISGCWWGLSFSRLDDSRLPMMLIGLSFGLAAALITAFLSPKWSAITLGFGHFLIWILEFFIPGLNMEHSYKVQRTILTMTLVVCHVLIAIQFL